MITLERQGCRVILRGPEGRYSIYDPARIFTGMGWDAEAASALLVGTRLRTGLLLGYGGGTVARQLRAMFPEVELTGVEVDPSIIDIARNDFSLDATGTRMALGRGEDYIRRGRRSFDFILDDMWDHDQHETRAILGDPTWPAALARRLTPHGVAAVNVFALWADPRQYRRTLSRMKSCFAALTEVRLPWERVCVIAGSKIRLSDVALSHAISRLPLEVQAALGPVEMIPC